jgi:hypothetical protein
MFAFYEKSPWLKPGAALCAAKHEEGVYRLHALT